LGSECRESGAGQGGQCTGLLLGEGRVGAADEGVVQLHGVILPAADWADVVASGGLVKDEEAAAWAGMKRLGIGLHACEE